MLGFIMNSSDRGFLKTWSSKQIFLKEKNFRWWTLLILDKAPAYPSEEKSITYSICALILPLIVASLLQPVFKKTWRKLLQPLLGVAENEDSINSNSELINVRILYNG
jgi:hypothetical protein